MKVLGLGTVGGHLVRSNILRNCTGVFIASGVSDSKSNSEKDFDRESSLVCHVIEECEKEKIPVYYLGSTSIFDSSRNDKPYFKHKSKIESLIKSSTRFGIIRVGEIVAPPKNNETLTNFFFKAILAEQCVDIYTNVFRNLIHVRDLIKVIEKIVVNSHSVNFEQDIISKYDFSPKEILLELSNILGVKAIFREVELPKTILESGTHQVRNIKYVEDLLQRKDFASRELYLKRLLSENYGDL